MCAGIWPPVRKNPLSQSALPRRLLPYNSLYSGIDNHIPMDHCVALRLFSDAASLPGEYDNCHKLRVIAGSCYIYILMLQQRSIHEEHPGYIVSCHGVEKALRYLTESCRYGMFTYSTLWMWLWLSSPPRNRHPIITNIPQSLMEIYLYDWDMFREETGVQPFRTTRCAYCQRDGVRHSRLQTEKNARILKQCSGSCIRDKKPLYCSARCQAMVSGGNR